MRPSFFPETGLFQKFHDIFRRLGFGYLRDALKLTHTSVYSCECGVMSVQALQKTGITSDVHLDSAQGCLHSALIHSFFQ